MDTKSKTDAAEALDVSAGSPRVISEGFSVHRNIHGYDEWLGAYCIWYRTECRKYIFDDRDSAELAMARANTQDDRRRAPDAEQPNGA